MNSRQSRRFGRQIPEHLIIGGALALSLFCGFPVRLFLKRNHPQLNEYLSMFVALASGFLILLAIVFALSALAYLAELFSRKK